MTVWDPINLASKFDQTGIPASATDWDLSLEPLDQSTPIDAVFTRLPFIIFHHHLHIYALHTPVSEVPGIRCRRRKRRSNIFAIFERPKFGALSKL